MMDVSDGLAIDLARLARASGVRCAPHGRRRPGGGRRDDRRRSGRRRGLRAAGDDPGRRRRGRAGLELKEAFGVALTDDRQHRRGRRAHGDRRRRERTCRSRRRAGTTSDDPTAVPSVRSRRPVRGHSRSPAPTRAAARGSRPTSRRSAALGVFGMTAITAITVQNTKGVYGYEALAPRLVEEQIRAVTTDIGVDAAKTGMLANGGIVRAVAVAVEELADPEPGRGSGVRLQARAPAARGGRGRRDPLPDPAFGVARHAEPLRGERPVRPARGRQGRHAPSRGRHPVARRGRGPGERRSPRDVDRGRRPVHRRRGGGVARRGAPRRRTRTGPAAR